MADSEKPGRLVAGRYRLEEPLGRGGMGIVWRAFDELLGRGVAVKELHCISGLTAEEREIFTTRTFREARAAGRLSHPGVAAVYDVFEEAGHPWIVMQLVPSRTLASIVAEEGPLPPRRVAGIGVQVLAALGAAHAAGVLHRDVKPDNVLVTSDGDAVLTDFGIATLEDDSPMTRTGVLMGTPAFIAPERAAGGQAEPASDLWSLGVTLFLVVEGRSPFHRGHALATLAAIMCRDPAPFSLAGALAPVIEGLLVKDPAERMTAAEAERGLRAVASGQAPEPVRTAARGPSTPPVGPAAGGSSTPPVWTAWGRSVPPAVAGGGRRDLVVRSAALAVFVGLAVGGVAYATASGPAPGLAPGLAAPGVGTPTVTVSAIRTVTPGPSARPVVTDQPTTQPTTVPVAGRETREPSTGAPPSKAPVTSPTGSGQSNGNGNGNGNGSNGNHYGWTKNKKKKPKKVTSAGNGKGN
ncbi:protein kinase [Sphaerisporangium sp. NPDC049002]|uniref:serine/threonine-protein kinase n=1 Tax=unclassified Sphaerisporangium TaxID=2630420 RepID=UPI0033F13E27